MSAMFGMHATGPPTASGDLCAVLPRSYLLCRSRLLGRSSVKLRIQNRHATGKIQRNAAGQRPWRRQQSHSHKSQQVTCMAHPRRQAKVAKQIEREVGNLLLTDKVLQKAVCPEKRIGIDSAVSAIASVTEVEMSTDLAIAKVYLSIFSDEQGKTIAISGLKRLEGYVRKHIATSMNLRMAPEVRFLQDDTIARAEHVYALLDQLKVERGGSILDTDVESDSTAQASHAAPSADGHTDQEQPSLEAAVSSHPEAPVGSDAFSGNIMPNKGAGRQSNSATRQRTPSLRFQKRT